MPISVRLDKQTETFLEETSRMLKTSKAEVIKRSLTDYCTHVLSERRKRPYELIKDLIGTEGSKRGDLSMRSEEILRSVFRRKD